MNTKTFAYGRLEADTDSWLLARDHVIVLDVGLLDRFDGSLLHQLVSVVGEMGFPPSSPGIRKLIVERIATHDAIEKRAYALFESGQAGFAADHWFRAERELLNM